MSLPRGGMVSPRSRSLRSGEVKRSPRSPREPRGSSRAEPGPRVPTYSDDGKSRTGERGVKRPRHAERIRNEYKYIERSVTEREREGDGARGEEGAAVCARIGNTSESYTHRHNSPVPPSSRARSGTRSRGSCLPPPFFPPRVPYEGPAESQSAAQCPLGLRTPRAGGTKDETRFEKAFQCAARRARIFVYCRRRGPHEGRGEIVPRSEA